MHGCQLAFAASSCLTDHRLGSYQGPACFSQCSFSLRSVNTCPISKGIYSSNHAFAVPVCPFQADLAYERSNLRIHVSSHQPRQSENPSTPAIRRLSSEFVRQKAVTVKKMQKKKEIFWCNACQYSFLRLSVLYSRCSRYDLHLAYAFLSETDLTLRLRWAHLIAGLAKFW